MLFMKNQQNTPQKGKKKRQLIVLLLFVGIVLFLYRIVFNQPPPEGIGLFEIEPANNIQAGQPIVWKIRYYVGATGIAKGGSLILRFPHPYYASHPPNWQPAMSEDGKLPVEIWTKSGRSCAVSILEKGWHPSSLLLEAEDEFKPGDEIAITLGSEGPVNPSFAPVASTDEFTFLLLIDPTGKSHYQKVPAHNSLKILPGPPAAVELIAPSSAKAGQPIPITLRLKDSLGNIASPSEQLLINIGLYNSEDISNQITIDFNPEEPGWKKALGPIINERGIVRLAAASPYSVLPTLSNPIRLYDELPEKQWFWGDLQGHSQMSDGTGSGESYYQTASGPGALDFATLSDHDWQITEEEWRLIQELCHSRYQPGVFVPLLSWEYSPGANRVIFYKGCGDSPGTDFAGTKLMWDVEYNDQPLMSWSKDKAGQTIFDFGDINDIYHTHADKEALVIPHTSATWEAGNDWDNHDPHLVRLVEIYSAHGSSEAADSDRKVRDWVERGSVRRALGRGYKLGFIASGDSHDGKPGCCLWGPQPGGLTALLAPKLDRDSIWEALYQRNVYATTGARILLSFSANETPMGQSTVLDGFPRINIEAHGTAVIEKVDLISGGEVIHTFYPEALDFTTAFIDGEFSGQDYYYIRLVQADGEMAWSSPVWVTSPMVPQIKDLSARVVDDAIEIFWEGTIPKGQGFYEISARSGNDGGEELNNYRSLSLIEPKNGSQSFIDRRETLPDITQYYLLVWISPNAPPVRLGLVSTEFPSDSAMEPDGNPINYAVHEAGEVQIIIYRLNSTVARRFDISHDQLGNYTLYWDGRDEKGVAGSGLHFYEITSGGFTTQRKPIRLAPQNTDGS